MNDIGNQDYLILDDGNYIRLNMLRIIVLLKRRQDANGGSGDFSYTGRI